MSDIFKSIEITWNGGIHTIEPDRCMRLAYLVEMALKQDSGKTFFDLITNPPLTGLAYAYAAALRYAGVAVSDAEVFGEVRNVLRGDGAAFNAAVNLIDDVMNLVAPQDDLRERLDAHAASAGSDDTEKKPQEA